MHLDIAAINYKHKIIDGIAIADALLAQVKSAFLSLPSAAHPPGMAFIRVGEDPASVTYVNKKNKVAQSLGIRSELHTFPITAPESHVLECIQKLNIDPTIHAILVQAPLPYTWNAARIFNTIDPNKDVDGFTTHNLGKLLQGHTDGLVPCTPLGILHLLKTLDGAKTGQHIVVIGRSITVGRPLSVLLSQKRPAGDATVSVCHSGSHAIEKLTRIADIIIVAVGRPHFLTAEMVRPGAIVIDVGINRIADHTHTRGYKLVGDCAFEALLPIVSQITPVPGGVGPLTVASLMLNILQVYKAFHSYK
jgi:methylenetetrahydrofolate dehydrogenase (NADP+)/methenyltetrahydrofolate cyclohydrolase